MKAMVKRRQVELEATVGFGMTPLHWAAVKGHLPGVQYLCEKVIDKETANASDWTPLHHASICGHLPVGSTCAIRG